LDSEDDETLGKRPRDITRRPHRAPKRVLRNEAVTASRNMKISDQFVHWKERRQDPPKTTFERCPEMAR